MNIVLKPEYEEFIRSQIQTGKYGSVEELIGEAILLLKQREQRIEELRQKIEVGTAQIAEGKVTDGELVFARLQENIDKMQQSGVSVTLP
ncbi:MAG: type II toxin-antitoxin system ParD family antitoxin [Microcoleus sp. PH2017_29_MFU_D_A]|jgi:antitoxin ParD1/3/4|uniref:type II toxin-antitoxin system ParD family antitoxin n=1 Tax=unclassified Microcoleus TaxID=2642155 RepID=UPI001DFBDF01|nr:MULTISPECIES: type II toxin-antitoxin system ParD family antitoxin [unclassified Microcoleus]MCC3419511.1 type II toxin-antitoxin system ParD family antitoxin [Microcoleus sp. PH2017_07_MST_O_A]MCC3428688.1 type II toxin-antitoxin system ParD family antitoxin [Microcoleus sp. PH2017_04_SCI_O_A]MCC3442688.1 type II toxin-antitoxin system ParD family antitoxin [Microcoleus sp. PH2017_03_ELD_O_A]MCC3467132.1 type II toxin-antitoxin system ParD family antitoxin [Microcoleus sp. PH2017_06_SFM_O_A